MSSSTRGNALRGAEELWMEGPASPESQQDINTGWAGIPIRSNSMAATHPKRATGGRSRGAVSSIAQHPLLFMSTATSHSTEGSVVPFHTAFQLGLWCVLILFVEIATSICTIPSISVSSPVKQGQGFLPLGQEQMNVKTLLPCWLNTGPSSGSYYCFFIVWRLET